jgi:hypothetical protein
MESSVRKRRKSGGNASSLHDAGFVKSVKSPTDLTTRQMRSGCERSMSSVRIGRLSGDVSERTFANNVYNSIPGQDLLVAMAPPNRWRSLFPGAANFDAFQGVGHALFALLAGLVGGTVGVWFCRRREPAEAAAG